MVVNFVNYLLRIARHVANGFFRRTSVLWPDVFYLKVVYWLKMGKKLNLKNPMSFNEKLQWLKLYDRKPEYTVMVDKVKVKEYVASKIGEEYIIPTLGVWERAEDIDFNSLPDKFVIKCNHNSGIGSYICRDKSKMDTEAVREGLRKGLRENYFLYCREWPYKNVPKRIIAEVLLEDKTAAGDLMDYKMFCFNGKLQFCKVDFNRFTCHQANYYSPAWSMLPFGEVLYPPDPNKQIVRPENFDKMVTLAQRLAEDIPFSRIDFYEVEGRVYFGEITFYPQGGFGRWTSIDADVLIGQLLTLSK